MRKQLTTWSASDGGGPVTRHLQLLQPEKGGPAQAELIHSSAKGTSALVGRHADIIAAAAEPKP